MQRADVLEAIYVISEVVAQFDPPAISIPIAEPKQVLPDDVTL